jgi:hypothetical protein
MMTQDMPDFSYYLMPTRIGTYHGLYISAAMGASTTNICVPASIAAKNAFPLDKVVCTHNKLCHPTNQPATGPFS